MGCVESLPFINPAKEVYWGPKFPTINSTWFLSVPRVPTVVLLASQVPHPPTYVPRQYLYSAEYGSLTTTSLRI